jgi:hypothetical protein
MANADATDFRASQGRLGEISAETGVKNAAGGPDFEVIWEDAE